MHLVTKGGILLFGDNQSLLNSCPHQLLHEKQPEQRHNGAPQFDLENSSSSFLFNGSMYKQFWKLKTSRDYFHQIIPDSQFYFAKSLLIKHT